MAARGDSSKLVHFSLYSFGNMILFVLGDGHPDPPDDAKLILSGEGKVAPCNLDVKASSRPDERDLSEASEVGHWVLGCLWHFCRSQKEIRILGAAMEKKIPLGVQIQGINVTHGPIPGGAYQIVPHLGEDFKAMKAQMLENYKISEAEFDKKTPELEGNMLCEFVIAWADTRHEGGVFQGDSVAGVVGFETVEGRVDQSRIVSVGPKEPCAAEGGEDGAGGPEDPGPTPPSETEEQ